MIVTPKDVAYVARLARLHLEFAETDRLTSQLEAILAYIRQLQQLSTDQVEPTSHVVPLGNVLRADAVTPSLPAEMVLALAPDRQRNFVRVPKIIHEP